MLHTSNVRRKQDPFDVSTGIHLVIMVKESGLLGRSMHARMTHRVYQLHFLGCLGSRWQVIGSGFSAQM